MLPYHHMRENKSRNERIRNLATKNPELTLEEIGKLFDMTRQRVHQIINNPASK